MVWEGQALRRQLQKAQQAGDKTEAAKIQKRIAEWSKTHSFDDPVGDEE